MGKLNRVFKAHSPHRAFGHYRSVARYGLLLSMLALIYGCGSSSSPAVQENIDPNRDQEPVTYTGPAPQTQDVQEFKLAIWDPLALPNRCGSCHGVGGQEPTFVRDDDINLAYSAVHDYVDLAVPANSRLVTKVAEGHNCWQGSAEACADIIAGYVEAWANAAGTIDTRVVFEAPPDREVGSSKIFPAEPGEFTSTVYPLLTEHCAECHARGTLTAQQPYLGSANVAEAYDAAKPRMRLDEPEASRLVRRLSEDGHNCWGDDCAASGQSMAAAIAAFADTIPETEVDPDRVVSRALGLGDGIVASDGGRAEHHLIAKYEFKTGSGSVAYDTSGVEPAANLNLSGDVGWMNSWGLRFNLSGGNGKAQASTSGSRKLHSLITATGEYSIEAWVIPDNVTQGDGGADTRRIVSYSGSNMVRNFTLGQSQYNYDFLHRGQETSANGLPALATAAEDERLQATLQHVVATFDPVHGRRIYVNGEFTGDGDPFAGAALEEWDESFALVVGNEVSGSELAWAGSVRFLAVHNRALSAEAIANNFEVGVGARFFLLFNVSHLLEAPDSYIAFEVQQFDDYSYLFAEPFFLVLDENIEVPETALEGIRIGVNGREAGVGQVFAALNTTIGSDRLVEGRQALSRQGAVIELQQGPDNDQFFLTFDRLGQHETVRVEADPPVPEAGADLPRQARIGLRSFAAIHRSLSAMTTVSHTRPAVASAYERVRQQLPTQANVDGFLAAHQMGVTQLSVAYCSALVDDVDLRESYFTAFNFNHSVADAFNEAGREAAIEPLLQRMLAAEIQGEALANQADPDALRTELNSLIDNMTANCAGCGPERTQLTVKALCAATMGSAVMLLQ